MGDNQTISQCPPGYILKENQVRCRRSGTETLCLDYPVCVKKEEATAPERKADPAGELQQKSADLKKVLEGTPKPPEDGKTAQRPEDGKSAQRPEAGGKIAPNGRQGGGAKRE